MEKGSITNAQITASTQYGSQYRSYYARLNSNSGSWVPTSNNAQQWLQVDLGKKTEVTGIKTQGRYNAHQWVTSYRVSYSNDGSTFQIYKENNKVKVCIQLKIIARVIKSANYRKCSITGFPF